MSAPRVAVDLCPKSTLGRADLVRAWIAGGDVGLESMAGLLGFEGGAARQAERPSVVAETSALGKVPPPRATEDSRLAPIPEWRSDSVTHRAPAVEPRVRPVVERLGPAGLGKQPGKPPRAPALVPEARLWAALRRRLASTVPSREVDALALAERWSRGDPVTAIPYRPLAAWASRVTVLEDRSAHLRPFWQDQEELLRGLARRLGRSAVRQIRYLEGYRRPWRDDRHRYDEPPVPPGSAVLALSDLGFLADEARRAFWDAIAERLDRGGTRPSALVLAPPSLVLAGLTRRWDAMSWARPDRAARASERLGDEVRKERAERLLALLSFASRIDLALLRAVRRSLPARDVDLGTEADAWNHPDVAGGDAPAAGLPRGLRDRLQARFAEEDPGLKRRVVDRMRRSRAGEPREVWLEEVANLAAAGRLPAGALTHEEIEAAEQLWRRIAATVKASAAEAPVVARKLRAWVERAVDERVSVSTWEDARWRSLLWEAWKASWSGKGDPPLPAGLGPDVLETESPGEPEVARWQARQLGGRLRFAPVVEFGADSPPGTPLAELESANGLVTVEEAGARYARPLALADGTIELPKGDFTLRTDRTVVRVQRQVRPAWATALGRDRFGLWATFEVKGVEQRMRWIAPGRFWMGSPQDEPGRFDDEGPRHLEIVNPGFWLGETPCTQALWEAVMGENPSRFKTADRPVEQVSWDDCQKFHARLSRELPEEDEGAWRLPSEAEWEYACRAGTETATYAGPIEILGGRNAPALSPIAWYGGNSGVEELDKAWDSSDWSEKEIDHKRAGTHPVAQKAPNPWGLYDTLGNVFEWCEDRWRNDYASDPTGSSRVIRGGSWGSPARYVRAAYRFRRAPSDRWNDLGFRLARGQVSALRPGAEPRGAERPDRGPARRGTRRPGPGSRPEAATE